jgi:hypothetical protein
VVVEEVDRLLVKRSHEIFYEDSLSKFLPELGNFAIAHFLVTVEQKIFSLSKFIDLVNNLGLSVCVEFAESENFHEDLVEIRWRVSFIL